MIRAYFGKIANLGFRCCLVIFCILAGCGKTDKDFTESVIPPELAEIVSHVTTGSISYTDSIRIRFVDPVVEEGDLEKEIENNFCSFKPAIKHKAFWEDTRTLVFKPDKELEMRKKYSGVMDVSIILPELKDKKNSIIKFSFLVKGRDVEKVTGQFEKKKNGKANEYFYEGRVFFTEKTDIKILEKAAGIKGEGKAAKIKWFKGEEENSFLFRTGVLVKTKKRRHYTLSLNRDKLGLSKNYNHDFFLEALGVFSVKNITTNMGTRKSSIKIIFSDMLNPNISIEGLVYIKPRIDFTLKRDKKTITITGVLKAGKTYSVILNRALGGSNGLTLGETKIFQISTEDVDPNLQFLSSGVFLPSANNQKIAFRTINIRKVSIEVKKVFENNLGQFLQTEKLDGKKNRAESFGSSYINRVGILSAEKTLKIGDSKNVWVTSAIDISKLLTPGDKGLFLISIDYDDEDKLVSEDKDEDDYYYYYNNRNRIYKPVILSDIGLTYKRAGDRHLIYASDLISAAPLKGINIVLRTYQNQIVAEKKTNDKGIADFTGIKSNVFYVTGENSDCRSVIKCSEMYWNLSSFETGGVEVAPDGTRVFVFTERGVYRPGDEINLTAIIRNEDDSFPDNHPVNLEFCNPRDQMVYTTVNKNSKDGLCCFKLNTAESDPTGTWTAKLHIGGKVVSHNIRVETIVPFKLKVLLKSLVKKIAPGKREINLNLSSTYLFGNPASGLMAEVDVLLKHKEKKFDKYRDYYFGNKSVSYKQSRKEIFKGKLDNAGKASILWRLPVLKSSPSSLTASITAKVFEKGGRPNINRLTLPVDPFSGYIGLKKPEFKYGRARVDKRVDISAIFLNLKGNSISGKKLKYKIYKNDYFWWWEYDTRERANFHYKQDRNTELFKEGVVVSKNTPVVFSFTPDDWGKYLIEIQEENGEGHRAGFFIDASHWGGASGNAEEAAVVFLKMDKEKYKPGEKAVLTFPKPGAGTIIFSIEKANKILKTEIFPIKNKNEELKIGFTITKEMLPNAYASISIIQPHKQTLNDRPIRMYGVVPINVEDPGTKQNFNITMNSEIKPNAAFSIRINTTDKKPARFVVAVVDEGLLDITGFKTPDPWKAFFAKQRLSVNTYDLFSNVIGADKNDFFHIFSIGGGYDQGIFAGGEKKKSRRFEPVSLFKGPLSTDSRGRAVVSFKMPNYMGSVRVMVIGANKGRYGFAEKQVFVKDRLMILPSLPRVLGPGDKITVPVSVFALKDGTGNVKINIKTSGPVKINGSNERKLRFSKKGDDEVFFTLQAKKAVGEAEIVISASSGSFVTNSKTNILVRASSPKIYESLETVVNKGQTVFLDVPGKGLPGTNRAVVSVSRYPNLNLGNRLKWLIHYPYGCIEQTTSSVFPQLYLKNLVANSKKRLKRMDKNINAGINRIKRFQTFSGGFSYWPGGGEPSPWGTNYAGHFLLEARKMGYNVPESLISGWVRFQTSRSLSTKDRLLSRVYRVYLLALSENPSYAGMNLLLENNLKDMSNATKWLLASAYSLSGMDKTASRIIAKAGKTVETYRETGGTYGSSLRDRAIILNGLVHFGRLTEGFQVFKTIANALNGKNWYSTQTTAYSLLAMGNFINKNNSGKDSLLKGRITFYDGSSTTFSVKKANYSLAIEKGFGKKVKIFIDSGSSSERLFARLDWEGIPLKSSVVSRSDNLFLKVRWRDEDGNTIDPSSLRQGSTIWGQFSVGNTSYSDVEELALVQIFPAGWEIENIRLSGEGIPSWAGSKVNSAEYTDIRDDRIIWFFDLRRRSGKQEFLVKINIVTVGEFLLPPVVFEAMYDNNYYAIRPGMKVNVTRN